MQMLRPRVHLYEDDIVQNRQRMIFYAPNQRLEKLFKSMTNFPIHYYIYLLNSNIIIMLFYNTMAWDDQQRRLERWGVFYQLE